MRTQKAILNLSHFIKPIWTNENAKGNIKAKSFHKTNLISASKGAKKQIVKARMSRGRGCASSFDNCCIESCLLYDLYTLHELP